VIITFRIVPECTSICHQPHVTTDSQGRYAITLAAGVYNAICGIEPPDAPYACGPRGGDGGPHPVNVPPQGQRLDFTVCSESQYPACLHS
jgi:hypothetical protein